MANAHDRTLLASLGFADPDKGDPLHDLACQYVAQQSTCNVLCSKFEPIKHNLPTNHAISAVASGGVLEQEISKGEGKYRTTIGFIDVVLPTQHDSTLWYDKAHTDVYCVEGDFAGNFLVEVKIKPVGLGAILRQINLYRGYVGNGYGWFLVAAFDMSASLEEGLRSQNITPIRLGEGFDKFVTAQRSDARVSTAQVI